MRFQRLGDSGHEIPVVLDETGTARDLRPLTTDIDGPFLAAETGTEPPREPVVFLKATNTVIDQA